MSALVSVDAILPGASARKERGKSQPDSTQGSGGLGVRRGNGT